MRFVVAVMTFACLGASIVHAQDNSKNESGTAPSSLSGQLKAAGALRQEDSNDATQALKRLRRWLASPKTGAPSDAENRLLADSDAVSAERIKLKDWLIDPANQRKLIASGALNAEIGNASLDRLRRAVADFRAATASDQVGMLSEAERASLDASEAEIDAFARFEERKNPKTGLPVYLPLGLVNETIDNPEDKDPSWTTFASTDKTIRLDQINYLLMSETPVSLATLLLERRKELEFDALELAGDAFKIEAFAANKDRTGREYVAFGAREIKDKVQGFGLRVALTPPAGLTIPAVKVRNPTSSAGTGPSTLQLTPEQENWRAVVKVLRNLIASRYNETESYKPISRRSCAGVEAVGPGTSRRVRILYATDRKPIFKTPLVTPIALEGLYSSELDATRLHLGCVEVVVGNPDSAAALSPYGSGLKQLFDQRVQDKPVTVSNFTPFESVDFTQPKRVVFRSDEVSGYERALLYIHGYNNGFEDAVRHVANIAATSEYYGQIYLFSWPSTQRVLNYAPDMDLAEQSEVHLSAFLKAIAASGDLVGLDIVAHSMGSQILLRTLDGLRPMLDRRLSRDGRYDRFRLGQIIFASPDVSTIVFAQKVMPFTYFADRVTVYASANDGVLALSSWLRGNTPRAGYIKEGVPLQTLGGVHVIDITREPESRYLLGNMCGSYHAAFIYDASVLEDISHILKHGASGRSAVRRATPVRRTSLLGIRDKFAEALYPQEPRGRYWALNARYGLPPGPPKSYVPSVVRLREDLCTNL